MAIKQPPLCSATLRDGSRCEHAAYVCRPCHERGLREAAEQAVADGGQPRLEWLPEWDRDIAHLPAPVRALIRSAVIEAPTWRDRLAAIEFISSKVRPAAGDDGAALAAIRRRARDHQAEIRSMTDDELAEMVAAGELGLLDGGPAEE